MKAKYVKEHNNYDLTLGNIYEATFYKEGWLLIKNDDIGNSALYRDECFIYGKEIGKGSHNLIKMRSKIKEEIS